MRLRVTVEVSKALIKHLGTDIIPAEITEKTKDEQRTGTLLFMAFSVIMPMVLCRLNGKENPEK